MTCTTSASHFTVSPYPTERPGARACDSPGRHRVHGEQPAAVLLSFSRLHRHLFVDVTTPLQRPELTPVELHHGPNAAQNNNRSRWTQTRGAALRPSGGNTELRIVSASAALLVNNCCHLVVHNRTPSGATARNQDELHFKFTSKSHLKIMTEKAWV